MSDPPSTISIRICQEGHSNALALNRDCSQIAVAGRSLLKVFSMEYDGFTEVCNMRNKNHNLSYSSNDVAWSSLDNILATAATNGVVSIWDLSKFGRQKQLLVYTEHGRTANTVTFHSTEPNLLLSGSQDGTIKCFDIRQDKSISTYFSNSESVRDVKFSHHSPNIFSSVSENGTVQLWDMKKPDKCILQFTAHSGPIYTCDWHPTKNWLATGSRDKQIKIWNMEGKASLEHTIPTIAVVGRVKWRPEKPYHIASCALVVDYSIHIWDIRRPYIPYASFNEHTNITTGIAFKGSDSHTLISTSKDSTIYKHAFRDAVRPSIKANNYGASLNYKGDLLYANKVKAAAPSPTNIKTSFMGSSNQKPSSSSEQFHLAQSLLNKFVFKPTYSGFSENNKLNPLKEYECFVGCAKEYVFNGDTLSDTCDANAKTAKKFGRHNANTLWNFIKIFYGTNDFVYKKKETRNSLSNQSSLANRRTNQPINQRDSTKWTTEDNKKPEESEDENLIDDTKLMEYITPKTGELKPYFGTDTTSTPIIFEKSQISFENFKNWRDGFLYVGPHDYTKALSLPETDLCELQHVPKSQQSTVPEHKIDESPPPFGPNILKITTLPTIPMWEPHQVISDCLLLQTEVGDVQTSLSILIAMGEARNHLSIEENLIEAWFHLYIETLHQHQLWNEAAIIINLSWVRSVRELNQKSTTVHTNCGNCGRPLQSAASWYCGKCKSAQSSKCSVCGLVVRGLYAWCQGCSHGGHLEHLKQWFSNTSKCPKCNHLCEYD